MILKLEVPTLDIAIECLKLTIDTSHKSSEMYLVRIVDVRVVVLLYLYYIVVYKFWF